MTDDLERRMRSLRLSGMVETLPIRNRQAVEGNLSHMEFLELLVGDELDRRRDRLLTRRLKRARLPEVKTIADFNFSFNPKIPRALILDMATARFVAEHRGLLLIGPSGVGKSHIAI